MSGKKLLIYTLLLILIAILAGCTTGGTGGSDGDQTVPQVISTSPEDGANGISTRPGISIEFSEPMNQTSVFQALSISGGVNFSSATWTNNNQQVLLSLDGDLVTDTEYTVTIDTDAQDDAGNSLNQQYSFSFTTISAVDTGSISGTITYAAGNLEKTNIIVFEEMDEETDQPDLDTIFSSMELTDTVTGDYSFTNIPPGTYYVAAYKDLDADGVNDYDPAGIFEDTEGPAQVTVFPEMDSDLTDITMSVDAEYTATISGEITDLMGMGVGIEGATVNLCSIGGTIEQEDNTDSEGNFSFPNVPIGASFYIEATDAGYALDTLTVIFVFEEEISGISLPLLDDTCPFFAEDETVDLSSHGFVGGDIVDNAESPVDGAIISLSPASGDTGYFTDSDTLDYDASSTSVEGEGKFAIKNIDTCTLENPITISAGAGGYTFPSFEMITKANTFTFVKFVAE